MSTLKWIPIPDHFLRDAADSRVSPFLGYEPVRLDEDRKKGRVSRSKLKRNSPRVARNRKLVFSPSFALRGPSSLPHCNVNTCLFSRDVEYARRPCVVSYCRVEGIRILTGKIGVGNEVRKASRLVSELNSDWKVISCLSSSSYAANDTLEYHRGSSLRFPCCISLCPSSRVKRCRIEDLSRMLLFTKKTLRCSCMFSEIKTNVTSKITF